MSRPEFPVVDRNTVSETTLERIKRKFKGALGKVLYDLVKPYEELRELEHINYVLRARSPGNTLSPEEIEGLSNYQTSCFDLELRKSYFRTHKEAGTLEKSSLHGLVMPLIRKILASDSSVGSVVDVGCNYAFIDHMLALEFPTIRFWGIDVPKNVVSVNEDLKLANFQVASGYALDWFKSGKLSGDVVYFSSTATAIKTAELRNYLETLAEVSKYVVFNEPLFVLPTGKVVDPDQVSIDESTPISIARGPLNGEYGYLCRAHNYRQMMKTAGFNPVYFEVYKPDFTNIYWVRCIGQNGNEKLWNQRAVVIATATA